AAAGSGGQCGPVRRAAELRPGAGVDGSLRRAGVVGRARLLVCSGWARRGRRPDPRRGRAEAGRAGAAGGVGGYRRSRAQADGHAWPRHAAGAEEGVELGGRAVAGEQVRFEAGSVPAKNVLDRQSEQAQAEMRAARVETDAAVARAELDGLTVENLDRWGTR